MRPARGTGRGAERVAICGTVAAAALAAAHLLGPAASAQCTLCREAIRTGAGPGFVRGIFWSYLILVAAPLASVVALGILLGKAFFPRGRGGGVEPTPARPAAGNSLA